MPLTLNVGVSKKVGQPDYGSLGASCNIDVELDASLLRDDLDGFQRHVRNAFTACRQAVNDELARNQTVDASATDGTRYPSQQRQHQHGNGTNGNGSHRATRKQADFINQLARQIPGLVVRQLDTIVSRLHSKPLADLNSLEASAVIDTLRAVKEGRIQLDAVLGEAQV